VRDLSGIMHKRRAVLFATSRHRIDDIEINYVTAGQGPPLPFYTASRKSRHGAGGADPCADVTR
jgi:hypothetical protein